MSTKMKCPTIPRIRKRIAAAALTALMVVGWTTIAQAQPGGGGRMSPEEAAKIWSQQAASVASELDLDDAKATKLADAYVASRKSQGEAMRSAAGGDGEGRRGGGRERFEAMQKLNDAESAKLGKELGEFLDEGQTKTALATLGAYDRQWDRLVGVLASLKLEEAKADQGLALILKSTSESITAREKAMASGEFREVREAMQEIKGKLDTEMAAVLSAEQLSTWKEETEMRRGGGRGPGGPGGGEGRGGREGRGGNRGGDPDGEQI